MTKYFQIEGTDELASSEEEAKKIAEQYYKEMKVPVKCKGTLVFEDFRSASKNFHYLTDELKNGIFYVPEEHSENPTYYNIEIVNDNTLFIQFNRFVSKEFLNENIDNISRVFESSLAGSVIFEFLSPPKEIFRRFFKKAMPDTLKEVKISGIVTLDSHLNAVEAYIYLSNKLSNTIFYNTSEIHHNIICDVSSIHFYCHRYFSSNYINDNLNSIKEIVESSKNADVVFEIMNSNIETIRHVLKK